MEMYRKYIRLLAFVAVSFAGFALFSCGDEKADSEDCRTVCRMIQQCEPQAYVTETRLEQCYSGCESGSIYVKKEYSVCLIDSGGCEDFEACLLAVDSGEYEENGNSED